MKKFNAFCTKFTVTDPFPVTEHVLCCFAAFMANTGLSPQTVRSYLAAVRNMQLSMGLPDPREQSSLPVLRRVLSGIARARLSKGTPARIRLPITAQILLQIKRALGSSSHPDKLTLWAVCCTAFFGFFRLGELLLESPTAFNAQVNLAWGDVAVDDRANPNMVRIRLKRSKTDQEGSGADIILGRTGLPLCPVAAMLGYIATRGARMAPFFLDSKGRALTKPAFVAELRAILVSLGYPQDQYAGHSFRIGAATSAALAGVEDSTIQLMGRWHSAAFLRYVRAPPEQLAAISHTLASQGAPQNNPQTQK